QKIIDKCAVYIAEGFSADRISARVRKRWEGSHVLDDLRRLAAHKRCEAEAYLAELEFPDMPSMEQLKARAHRKFKIRHEGLDRAIERAYLLLRKAVSRRLIDYARSS